MEENKFGIYFNDGPTTIRIPVNPEELLVKYPTDNARYNVLALGEIIVPRLPNLEEISWDSFFPANADAPYVLTKGKFEPPEFYVQLFKGFQKQLKVVRFIANGCIENEEKTIDINTLATVENFEIIQRGGETGDVYYSIELSGYREFKPQPVIVKKENSAIAVASKQRSVPQTKIVIGDKVVLNGTYYNSSYGDKPCRTANNKTTTVTRIVSNPKKGQSYPYHVGYLGWVKQEQLKKV